MTATATTTDHCHCREEIFTIAHTARMGAFTIICSPIEMSICTCVMSLVVRVIRLAVEKRLISSIEKLSTLSNTCPRRRNATADAMRAAKYPTMTELAALPSAQASMMPPCFQISPIGMPVIAYCRIVLV